jgi:cell division protein FtsB
VSIRKISPFRFWLLLTFAWLGLLSGVFFSKGGGPPGFLQWLSLRNELQARQQELTRIETETAVIEAESLKLEKSRFHQEKEIRRVLGYTAPDELIFDFSAAERTTDWPNRR